MLERTATLGLDDAEGAVSERTQALLPCETKSLTYSIGGKTIIDALDLTLRADAVSVIMGPNGAGKSVLVRLLHGMLAPTTGSISWGGKSLDESVRKRQAMVFQTPVLLRRSVEANVAFALSLDGQASSERCVELLAAVGLEDQARQPARQLSGGERQRLAMARALATNPEVLFLDEPTASLDPASVLAIEEIVSAAHARGVKIVFITHDIGQARRLADEVIFLHRGRVMETSPAKPFFNKPKSREAGDYLAGRIVL